MATRNPSHETKAFLGTVVIDPETSKKRVKVKHPTYYQHEIDQLQLNSEVTMFVTSKKPRRSLQQNSYMHLYFSLIAVSSGHTTKEIKNWAKGKHLSHGITEVFGDKVRIVDETSKLTVNEMIEFIARVECDTGIPAPDPSPFNLGITHEEFQELKMKQRQEYMRMTPRLSTGSH